VETLELDPREQFGVSLGVQTPNPTNRNFHGDIAEVRLYNNSVNEAGALALAQELYGMYVTVKPAGDFNGDGALNALDIDLLSANVGGVDLKYDVNSDGKVDPTDRDVWVKDLRKTWYGDANMDGEFSSADFVAVFTIGEYEDATVGNSTWADGDWNGDKDFTSSDFVFAFQDGGYEKGPRVAVAVPEPSMNLVVLLVCLRGIRRLRYGIVG
jgi:hypothetical protein